MIQGVHKELESALRRLEDAQRLGNIGNWEWDLSADNATWSRQLFTIYGRDHAKGVPDQFTHNRQVHPDDVAILEKAISESLKTGTYRCEYRIYRENDGELRHIQSIGEVLFDDQGYPVRQFGTAQDITDLKRLKDAFSVSKTIYEQQLQQAGLGIGYYDLEGKCKMMNKVACAFMNIKEEEILEKNTIELFGEQMGALMIRRFSEVTRDNINMSFEDEAVIAGKKYWFKSTYAPIYNERSEITGIQIISENVTERKEIDIKNTILSQALEKSLNGFLIVNESSLIEYVNQALLVMCGYERAEEIIGQEADVLFWDKEDALRFKKEMDQAGSVISELRGKKKDGTAFDALLYFRKEQNYEGKTVYHGSTIDISKLKEAESELIESEKKFRLSFENSSIPMAMSTGDSRFISVNMAFCKLSGYSRFELLKMSMNDITHPDDRLLTTLRIDELSIGRKQKTFKKRYLTKSGDTKITHATLIPNFDESGKLLHLLAHIQDITEEAQARKNLKEREEHFRTIFESAKDAIFLLKENRITDCNQATANMFGFSSKTQVLGLFPWDFSPEFQADGRRSDEKAIELIEKAEKGEAITFEWLHVNREGEFFDTEVLLNLIWIREEPSVLAMFRNISYRKKAEKELKQLLRTFEDILTYNPSGMLVYEYQEPDKLKLLSANNAAVNILGFDFSSYIGKTLDEIWPGEEGKKNRKMYLDVYHSSEQIYQEQRFEFAGFKGILRLNVFRIPSSRIVVAFENITESAEAMRKLEDSENRYRDLVEKSNVAIAVDDMNGDIVYHNEYFALLFGYSDQEIKSLGRYELIHPDYHKFVMNNHKQRMAGRNAAKEYEIRGIKKDGTVFWLSVRTTVLIENDKFSGTRNYMWDITERKESERKLQISNEEITRLSRHIEAIREEEQRKISADLHDNLGQLLSALKMDISWINSNVKDNKLMIRQRASSSLNVVDEAISSVRQIASNLRPPVIDNLGLYDALEILIIEFRKRSDLNIQFSAQKEAMNLDPELSISLYRIVQEALTNIVRHAAANNVLIEVFRENGSLNMIVQDDGVGLKNLPENYNNSIGIISMRERVLRWNGSFSFTNNKGKGTNLQISIPQDKISENSKK